MKTIRLLISALLLVVLSLCASAETLRGVVLDQSGIPLAAANVSLDRGPAVLTSADGKFSFETGSGRHALEVSRSGFKSEQREVVAAVDVEIALRPALSDSIVVSGIRADEVTPVSKSNLDRADLDRQYHQQDIPLLLRDTPSINAYTESGIGGSGYSYITLRGVSSSRINFTLDGVPLADGEDMTTYFADFPDLASSLQSIQVQRGVGTSTVGSASFGGSVNLESIDLTAKPQLDVRVAGGSFGARFATVGYQSGLLANGLAFYSRLSVNETDGYRAHSGVRQHNLFVSAAKQFESSQLKLTGFSGHEQQQMSFLATDAATLVHDVRNNPLAPEERDSFGYDLAQLQYIKAVSPTENMTASAYYQRGYGWYRLFDDNVAKEGLRQYGLDGLMLGSMMSMNWALGQTNVSVGLHVNEFRREHTRDLVDGPRDYYNYGTKQETNVFGRLSRDFGRWHLYGDAQLRTAAFHYHGDVAIEPVRWTFFNPKAGARYDLAQGSSLYFSAGATTREPARNDLFEGEDNATVVHDLRAVRPERLRDFEAGWNCNRGPVTLGANLYAMEFRDEIAATGELSEIGLPLRRNVDRSSRRGVELDARTEPTSRLRLRTVANVSRNRIAHWTQSYDVYDAAGNYLESRTLLHRNVNPLLTPSLLVSQSVDFAPAERLSLEAVARYVGRSFLDNTNNRDFTTPSFTTLDASVAVTLTRAMRVTLQISNATNVRHDFPSGYSYLTMSPAGAIGGTAYYYPQATRSVLVMIDARP